MRIITAEREVLVTKSANVAHRGIESHLRQGSGLAGQLLLRLIEVIRIEVQVTKGMDEITGDESADLRHHLGKKGVAGDVEWDTEKNVRAALIELAAQPSLLDVKLKERVTRRQCHLVELPNVPGADDVTPAIRVGPDLLDHRVDLID